MNGELKCHNSESIIIKIAAIVVHSYVCEYISVLQFLSLSAHQCPLKLTDNKHNMSICRENAAWLTWLLVGEAGFFSEAQTSLKRAGVISMIHAVGLSWADQQMEAETNGNSDQ